RVRRGDGAVAAVLVVVDEDPLAALLLPPRGGDAGGLLLQLTTEGDRGVADVDELPAWLDAHEDVHASVAAGLGEGTDPEALEGLPGKAGNPLDVGEGGAGLRVEVDAQLVGPVDVGSTHRPGVEGERAHVCAPD